ncbi:fe-s assembly co-chaperone [Trichoderma cornu-damae]|uniref:Fe-s assembly co-chaperone n=1 Tax=Trichoderma cornu-damae TaxID=654480 RepID=A0A9P8QTY3_9HYPO|nr:fe-s assembly co-chaperone [Trichoderma cornu-damae]
MRSTASAAKALRDVSRLCTRCRLRAAPFARPNRPSHRIAASAGGLRCLGAALLSSSSAASAPSEPPPESASASGSDPEPSQPASAAPESPSSPGRPSPTHYDMFPETLPRGPPPGGHFPVDPRALRREFLRLQARHHPDMHPPGPLKARAEATSALINEAYKTLANPLLRAQYLLSLRGVDVAHDETMQVDDPSLLMMVLEAHEEISDAHREEDLRGLREANDARIRRSEDALETAFRDDDVLAAKKEAVRLRYWVNIKQSLDNWEEGRPVVLEH